MRAKRSKKYRKIMSAYNMHFSFRTPYQVLCDSNFLRMCHTFHMPIQKYLENTLHGDSRPFLTQCTLASITKAHEKKFAKNERSSGQKGRGDGKPLWLPLPEEMPLRYCKHKDDEGNERGIIGEEECLVDLLSGQVKGNEVPKNKQHYVLATAESEEEQKNPNGIQRRRRGPDIREKARVVPGVPIVYVKRSVMILEEMSGTSERVIRGVEKDKFKEGLVGAVRGLKRKRDDESDDDSENEAEKAAATKPKPKGQKGPNPLSVKKKKTTKTAQDDGQKSAKPQDSAEQSKKKNRRKRGKKGGGGDQDGDFSTAQDTLEVPSPASASATATSVTT